MSQYPDDNFDIFDDYDVKVFVYGKEVPAEKLSIVFEPPVDKRPVVVVKIDRE